MVQIIPSILSADFANLAAEIERVERGGASMLHLDIMDGHFVPNLTIGPPVVKAIRRVTRLKLDLHLMITDPDPYAPIFIEGGDFVVVISVNPGFGGQEFIPQTLEKVRRLDRKRQELRIPLPIEIDGGITAENVGDAVRAGCDSIVTGTSIFHTPDPAAAMANILAIAREAAPVRV